MTESLPPRSDETVRYDATFIGRGFNWPMGVDHTGSIALTNGAEDLDRSIRIVLLTAPGERVMRPQFGCRIWDLLFEPITPNLLGLIAEAVRDAIAPVGAARRWSSRWCRWPMTTTTLSSASTSSTG